MTQEAKQELIEDMLKNRASLNTLRSNKADVSDFPKLKKGGFTYRATTVVKPSDLSL